MLVLSSVLGAITGCVTPPQASMELATPEMNPNTQTENALKWLPLPSEPIPVAVYGMQDETGAFKPTEATQTLSRAVTQGSTSILVKALQDAGNRGWFKVIERAKLDNLLKERQIILEMRQRYLGEPSQSSNALPSLLFAGILLEGAITGYDTNVMTGGAGAQYLGIGASTQYREDAVSVYLRAVSVKTGEVLLSVSTEQRVASVATQGSAFKFVSFRELFEAEAGITLNQPRHLAVRQAIEKAVLGLVIEGAKQDVWTFADASEGQAAIDYYDERYSSVYSQQASNRIPPTFIEARRKRQQKMLKVAEAELLAETENETGTTALAGSNALPNSSTQSEKTLPSNLALASATPFATEAANETDLKINATPGAGGAPDAAEPPVIAVDTAELANQAGDALIAKKQMLSAEAALPRDTRLSVPPSDNALENQAEPVSTASGFSSISEYEASQFGNLSLAE